MIRNCKINKNLSYVKADIKESYLALVQLACLYIQEFWIKRQKWIFVGVILASVIAVLTLSFNGFLKEIHMKVLVLKMYAILMMLCHWARSDADSPFIRCYNKDKYIDLTEIGLFFINLALVAYMLKFVV